MGRAVREQVGEMGLSTTRRDGLHVLSDVGAPSTDDLRRLAEVGGPCVTLYLPSTPFGPGTRSGPARLHHLATEAASRLQDGGAGPDETERILAPIRRIEQDDAFWQHQGQGLALFVAPQFFEGFRLAAPVSERVRVGPAFRLLPLVAQGEGNPTFYILALSQNSVRLLESTAHGVSEIAVPGLPSGMEQALPEAEPDRVRGVHSVGALGAIAHGQGTEADYDKRALERYFRAVDDAVVARLRGRVQPLVLACVEYYVPMYHAVSRCPSLWQAAVVGSPERRSAKELHDAAWPLVAGHFAQQAEQAVARYREAAGTGRTVTTPEDVLAAARDGKVDTLLLDAVQAASSDDEVLEQAVAETVRRSGTVLDVGATAELGTVAAAVLRY